MHLMSLTPDELNNTKVVQARLEKTGRLDGIRSVFVRNVLCSAVVYYLNDKGRVGVTEGRQHRQLYNLTESDLDYVIDLIISDLKNME